MKHHNSLSDLTAETNAEMVNASALERSLEKAVTRDV
jgi:hypothetical protein